MVVVVVMTVKLEGPEVVGRNEAEPVVMVVVLLLNTVEVCEVAQEAIVPEPSSYMFRRFDPPHNSAGLPLQCMLHPESKAH